ncbi:FHA domain-containing protein [Pseudactinotalea sp.]|uniref:FHA domain-containing protein n=1 Tax=Pseudactinotalea sp. TaxID=1926260 RepID=UPI003B3A1D74
MSAICPQGHTSESEDYCDTCGSPIESAAAAPVVASPAEPDPGSGAATTCPHCGSPAAPGALFCENCGYDFTTGTAPQPVSPDPWALPTPSAGPDPAEGGPPAPAPTDPDPGAEQSAEGEPGDPDENEPAPSDPEQSDPEEEPAESEQPTNGGLPTPPAPGPDEWVAEVWVDPDWYAAQDPEDPMPAPGSPQVIPLRAKSVLVGRPSASRGIKPDVDAGEDTGVSRRHCQLTTDGLRWWVEDLESANGTYVNHTGDPLPTTPIDPGERYELADDERVFIGGWTRVVIRMALPGEV